MPVWLRDNDFIQTGYRLNYENSCEVAQTMCKCHNETVNVWSHFLGMLTFFGLALAIIICFNSVEAIGEQGMKHYRDTSATITDLSLSSYLSQKIALMDDQLAESQKLYSK